MKFERLELVNFASYYDEHVIDLSCSPDKPVIIILGGTGYGKTTLFDAINWALYGKDYEKDLLVIRRNRTILDYVNETALREAELDSQLVEMSCTLYFEHNGLHYYISQSLAANPYRDTDGQLKANQTDRLTVLNEIQTNGNHKQIRYDGLFLDEILPTNVKNYFLFDGDRIYNLSQPGSSQEVRDAIYRVVDLELLKNAHAHLLDVATEYRRAASKESKGDLSNVEEKYNKEHQRLDKLKAQLRELKEENTAIELQIKILEEELKNIPDTSGLQGRRSELEKRREYIRQQIDLAHASLRGLTATAGLGFASEPAASLMDVLDAKRHKGEIPKTVSQTLIKDLIKIKRCICGTEFEEGDEHYQALLMRLEAEKTKPDDQTLLDLLIDLRRASSLISDAAQRVREGDKELHSLKQERQEIGLAIDQIDKELDKLPKVDVASLVAEAKQRRNALITNGAKAGILQQQINTCEENIRLLENQREELGKKQAKVRSLQLRERLAQRTADEIEKIYEVFAETSRQAVEELTVQEFKRFVNSASEYRVALSKDYELEVLDSNGNRALQRLSMGQSQCLSLSFITAISRVSEKNPPLVIDMPFGRLDQVVHDSISGRLPDITSQLILFLIPGIEWNTVTERNLADKSSHIYQLQFDKINRQTTIRKA